MKRSFFLYLCFTIFAITRSKADPTLSFAFGSYTVSEGAGNLQVYVNILNPNANDTQVDINVAPGGTATNGVNFTYAPITITFPVGTNGSQLVLVTIKDDSIPDGDKFFTFKLASPTNNASLNIDSTVITITDADTLRIGLNTTAFTLKQVSGALINIPINLSHFSNNTTEVQIQVDTAFSTAVSGVDYDLYGGGVSWSPGTSGTINLGIGLYYYTYYQPERVLRIKLVNPTNGAMLTDSFFTLTILPNGSAPCTELFFGQYIVGTGSNQAIQIYNPTNQAINLSGYSIIKNSVIPNISSTSTYFNLSGMLAPGDVYVGANPLSGTQLSTAADTLSSFFDFDSSDNVGLRHGSDTIDLIGVFGAYNNQTGWGTDTGATAVNTLIRNYYEYGGSYDWNINAGSWFAYPRNMFDSIGFHHTAPCGTPAYPILQFTMVSDTVPDSLQTVAVAVKMTYTGPSARISYTIARDDIASTAAVSVDYSFGNVPFNQFIQHTVRYDTVYIDVLQNTIVQPTRKAILHFTDASPQPGLGPDSTFTLYITNNNKLTTSFLGAGFSYVEDAGDVEVKLVLSSPVPVPVSVNVTQAPGNATNGLDYIFSDTTITFPAYSIDTQGVWIHIIDDTIVERNEQINFNMTCLTPGIALGITAYTLTIIDNDSVATGIWDNYTSNNELSIFPNPVAGHLNIRATANWPDVSICDLLGNVLIRPGSLRTGVNTFDVSSLPAGMFFVMIKSEDKAFSAHFIKSE